LTLQQQLNKKFGILRGNFPNPNQRWLTQPEQQKLTQPNHGQKFLTQTHHCTEEEASNEKC